MSLFGKMFREVMSASGTLISLCVEYVMLLIIASIYMQDFCQHNYWPPLKSLKPVQGEAGKSCKEVCLSKGMF